jgi:hypothetical protein
MCNNGKRITFTVQFTALLKPTEKSATRMLPASQCQKSSLCMRTWVILLVNDMGFSTCMGLNPQVVQVQVQVEIPVPTSFKMSLG